MNPWTIEIKQRRKKRREVFDSLKKSMIYLTINDPLKDTSSKILFPKPFDLDVKWKNMFGCFRGFVIVDQSGCRVHEHSFHYAIHVKSDTLNIKTHNMTLTDLEGNPKVIDLFEEFTDG